MAFLAPRHIAAAAVMAAAAVGCRPVGPAAPSLGVMPFPVDHAEAQTVAPGVTRRTVRSASGPWTINVLYVDLDRCNTAEAVKGADTAIGRYRTSTLLAALAMREKVVGGVNADFFTLKDGSPTNLLIVNGRMLSPPNNQPVLALDSAGVPHISTFALRSGHLAPFYPRNAVGGRPVLVRDSAIDNAVDTAGQASFRQRNPRTAAGIARVGRRLILVTVDGREFHNVGMTLRELGELMLALGARDAINLDGGGSTTFIYADPDSAGRLRIGNHPSDKEGERTVGDALAIVHACDRSGH
ncbi:MAG: phosphodiester glycosidase family protein [Gemmatimonadaceae bacterium]